MSDALENAKRRLEALRAEIEKVQQFIDMFHEFSGGQAATVTLAETTPAGVSQGDSGGNAPVENYSGPLRPDRPTPRQIAEIMERVIREAGRPMTRGEIVAALEARDVEIPAQDKARYVGTVAWRHKGIFKNIEGLGYWLHGEPWRPSLPPSLEAQAKAIRDLGSNLDLDLEPPDSARNVFD